MHAYLLAIVKRELESILFISIMLDSIITNLLNTIITNLLNILDYKSHPKSQMESIFEQYYSEFYESHKTIIYIQNKFHDSSVPDQQ